MLNKDNKTIIKGQGSVELEGIVRETLTELCTKSVEDLSKKYFRDIDVEIVVRVRR